MGQATRLEFRGGESGQRLRERARQFRAVIPGRGSGKERDRTGRQAKVLPRRRLRTEGPGQKAPPPKAPAQHERCTDKKTQPFLEWKGRAADRIEYRVTDRLPGKPEHRIYSATGKSPVKSISNGLPSGRVKRMRTV